MPDNYFPILLFVIVGISVGLVPIALGSGISRLLGVHRPDSEKLSPTNAASRRSRMRA